MFPEYTLLHWLGLKQQNFNASIQFSIGEL